MELNHLRQFFEVARAGSFTKAARNLRISQSALSKTVALLEARENVKLLERSKKGVVLTALGAQVYAQAEGIFSTVDSIQKTFRNYREVCEGPLRLGASDHIANYLLAPQAGAISKKYPGLLPAIFSGAPPEVADLVLKGDLEFGLSFTKLNLPGLVYSPACEAEMAIVYKPGILPSGKKSLAELMVSVGYISAVRRNPRQHPAPELFEVLGSDPRVVFEATSQENQKRLCLQGLGFAYLARFMVEAEIKAKELAEYRLKDTPKLTIYVVRKKSAPLSFNARSFLLSLGWVEASGLA